MRLKDPILWNGASAARHEIGMRCVIESFWTIQALEVLGLPLDTLFSGARYAIENLFNKHRRDFASVGSYVIDTRYGSRYWHEIWLKHFSIAYLSRQYRGKRHPQHLSVKTVLSIAYLASISWL